MAAIEKRTAQDGTVTYRVKVRLRGQPVQSASFASLTKAKQRGTNTEAAIREGRYFQTREAQRHTLAEAIERYTRENLPKIRTGDKRLPLLQWWRDKLGNRTLAGQCGSYPQTERGEKGLSL